MLKKPVLLALLIIFYTATHAQSVSWMKGIWKSRSEMITSSGNAMSTILINNASIETFSGIKTVESSNGAKVSISISGAFRGKGMYLQDGEVVHKEPVNASWYDCSACPRVSKIIVNRDSLLLIDSISDCDNQCNSVTCYYRLFSEYDDDLQHYLVDRFGRPADIIGFHPFAQQEGKTPITNDDTDFLKNDVAANAPVNKEKIVQPVNDADRVAQQKKRQQEITDSLHLVQQKEKQRVKDSLDNVARLKKIKLQTEDSLRAVQAKKRQQQIADSINLAQQKKQQRLQDSLDAVAKARQQYISDSILLAQQKMREQEIADSINLAKQKEQQRINDSLQRAAAAALQQQRTADSLVEVQARKRQQEITDSLAALRRQAYNDSLQKANLAKAVPLSKTDSVLSAANKALTSRTNVLLQTYHITSPDILIELFDNGEIDSDRVSVYHNSELIVSNQVLGTKPITLNIHADANNREHEFVLIAENLGSIPPNSALMRITAGKQTYKLSVNTDMKTNARILFYYDGN